MSAAAVKSNKENLGPLAAVLWQVNRTNEAREVLGRFVNNELKKQTTNQALKAVSQQLKTNKAYKLSPVTENVPPLVTSKCTTPEAVKV
jgi:hypothetical protein